jgi:twinkle protein
MAQMLTADAVDFSAYLEETDAAHKVVRAGSFVDDVIAYYHANTPMQGAKMPWRKTHANIRFRPGEMTLWAGMNGHGKSLVLGQVVLGFIAEKQRACIASMEMKPMISLARICRQANGSPLPDADFIRRFHSATDGLLWLYDQQGTVRPDMMLAVVRYCADRLRVDHFVIDSLMKCGIDEDDFNRQKRFIDSLTAVARDTGIHIHVVAHSRKKADEHSPPGKMDVKGTGSITDQVDNVMTVWRNKRKEADAQAGDTKSSRDPDAMVICDKQRNGEWEGRIGLWYLPAAMQFVEDGISGPMGLLAV